jgi:hypothetical protein
MILITTFAHALTQAHAFFGRTVTHLGAFDAKVEVCDQAHTNSPEFVVVHGVDLNELYMDADPVYTTLPNLGCLGVFTKIYLKTQEGPWIKLS